MKATEQAPDHLNINFNHRLCAMDSTTSGGLADSINLMADRAGGVLYLLSSQFESEDSTRFSDSIVSGAIDSAIQEIEDMKQTVNAFYKFHKGSAPPTDEPKD